MVEYALIVTLLFNFNGQIYERQTLIDTFKTERSCRIEQAMYQQKLVKPEQIAATPGTRGVVKAVCATRGWSPLR